MKLRRDQIEDIKGICESVGIIAMWILLVIAAYYPWKFETSVEVKPNYQQNQQEETESNVA